MKATESNLLEFIKKSPQFIIPIYQRTYSWTEKECRQLWNDIFRAGTRDDISAHFVGSVVYIQDGLYQVTAQSSLQVIDGQQRLTTISLILAALAEAIESLPEDQREPLEGFSPRKLRNYYLLNPEEEGEKHYKLLLSQTDKDTLLSIVGQTELPEQLSIRVKENFDHFSEWLNKTPDLAVICRGIAKLLIVDTSLTRGDDNPQLIFESMNSTGRELSQADLIRNFVLMGLEPDIQTRLYRAYWRRIELDFGQQAYGEEFDAFMRHFLTLKTGSIPRKDEVYDAFKTYARSTEHTDDVEALVAEIRNFARYYCAMALGRESDSVLREAFQDLKELKVEVAYPFLLELYEDYDQQLLSKEEFAEVVRLTESYVFRRAIVPIPTNSLNKTFATFAKSIQKDRYLESIKAHFLTLPSYRRFPRRGEFERSLKTRDLYKLRIRSYFLRRLENHGRKERIALDEYTIEHILPQNENLPEAWKTELGGDWERVHQTWLHTLGNLTLTRYNSEYSDYPFADKRDMKFGFAQSPLQLNEGLGQLSKWTENQIIERADRLADIAASIWAEPSLTEDQLATYRAVPAVGSTYSLADHPYLLTGITQTLYREFRREVLALDPVVTEEFLKLYVAFKAETNFVDVVPQASGLRLSLNMKWPELSDPRGMCIDVSGKGRWGNGDVELKLTNEDDLPYVLGLVRQSLELQLGSESSLL